MIITKRIERDLILADDIICAALRVEADAIGVTLEEYVDRFLEVFYSEPQKLTSIIMESNKN